MTVPEDFDSLVAPLTALQRLFETLNFHGVIIGGVAVGLMGRPRFTVDVDAVVLASLKDIPHILEQAHQEGIEPRIKNAADFARKSHVLVLEHSASKVGIDISLGMLPFEYEMVERSTLRQAGAVAVRLPTPEDLIILKAIAHRAKDLIDIQSICESNPHLDLARIERWVKSFAEVLDLPDLWTEIEGLVKA